MSTQHHNLIEARLSRLDEIERELTPLLRGLTTGPATFLETGAFTAADPGRVDNRTAGYAADRAAAVARTGALTAEVDTIQGELETAAAALRSSLE